MTEAMIVAAARTPIGRAFKGSLKDERPDEMAAQVVRQALDLVPELDVRDIEDLLLGCGSPGGEQGFNMARVVAVMLGFDQLPGVTLTRYCASSVQTTRMAMHGIKSGEGEVYISAGVESCSAYPRGEADSIPDTMNPRFDDARARSAAHAEGADRWEDLRTSGLCRMSTSTWGRLRRTSLSSGVTRSEMDEYALQSQQRAAAAIDNGFWGSDITPTPAPTGR